MNSQDNPYYCPLIFNGLYVEKINQDQVRYSACCVNALGPQTSAVDFDHDPHLEQQRELARQGQIIPGCSHCNNNPTVYNLRHSAIRSFEMDQIAVNLNQPILSKLDWNVDPVCNARCITCSAHFSSAWAAEDAANGKKTIAVRRANTTRHNSIAESLNLSKVTNIYFNGGEPFLSTEPLEFLQRVDQLGTISALRFSTNTNGSIRPSTELMNFFQSCKSVTINFSIDAVGSEFEYIRNPLNWIEVENNLKWLLEQGLKNLSVSIGFTLGVYNIDLAQQTADWADQFGVQGTNIKFAIQPCYGILSLDYTSRKLKEFWLKKFQSPGHINNTLTAMLNSAASESDDTGWQRYLENIDQRRGLDWKTSLPALADAVKKSQSLKP